MSSVYLRWILRSMGLALLLAFWPKIALADEGTSAELVLRGNAAALQASCQDLAANGDLQLMVNKAKGPERIEAAKLIRWGHPVEVAAGPWLILATGDILHVEVSAASPQQWQVADSGGQASVGWIAGLIPAEAIRGAILIPPANQLQRDRLWQEIVQARREEDVLQLTTGERLTGELIGFVKNTEGIFVWQLKVAAKPVEIPAQRVVAVLNRSSKSLRPRKATTGDTWLGLADGSTLCVRKLALKEQTITCTLAAGCDVSLTLPPETTPAAFWQNALRYVQPLTAEVQYLAQLKPLGYKHVPYLADPPELTAALGAGATILFGQDQSLLGGRLRTGGQMYPRGLAMPSASRLAYALETPEGEPLKVKRFAAQLAVDDSAGGSGSVIGKVLLEDAGGKWAVAYESPVVRGGQAPVSVLVELKQAKRLALLIEFADQADVNDHASWLDARFER